MDYHPLPPTRSPLPAAARTHLVFHRLGLASGGILVIPFLLFSLPKGDYSVTFAVSIFLWVCCYGLCRVIGWITAAVFE